jgi:RNA polymerase sigma-70 factor (ECF subfamily)
VAATDAELVERALDGAEPAYRELVQRYERPVFAVIVRMVRDPARAEELAQDTFVKAFAALHTYDIGRSFSTWLLSIAHHAAVDHLRKRAIDTTEFTDDVADRREPSPETLLERAELATALQDAIGRLRPEYRELIALQYDNELGYAAIAEITGLPVGTVKSYLHRARKELAGHLSTLGWGK